MNIYNNIYLILWLYYKNLKFLYKFLLNFYIDKIYLIL